MNKIDIAMTIYIIFMLTATFGSYKYGSLMIRKTGLFIPQFLIAGIINLALGVLAIVGWFFFSWRINEFMSFGGLVLGVGLLVVGQAVLFTSLYFKRKQWIQIFIESTN